MIKKIIHFFRFGFAVELAYPIDFVGYIVTTVFIHITRLLFLNGVFALTPLLAGWSHRDVMVAFVFSVLLSGIVDAFTPSIRTFVSYAHSGRLEPFLVQPVNAHLILLTRWVQPGSLIVLLCIIPFACFGLVKMGVHATFWQIITGFFALLVGAAINIIIMAIWSLSAFVAQRLIPTEFILRQVMRLNQLPPSLFGEKTLVMLFLFLPIVLTSTVPAMILSRSEYHLLFPMLASLLLAALAFIGLFRMTLRAFNGTGG